MKVIEFDNITIFMHEYGNHSIKTKINISENKDYITDLIIGYNPNSSVYDENAYEEDYKSPFKPFANNIWYLSITYKRKLKE